MDVRKRCSSKIGISVQLTLMISLFSLLSCSAQARGPDLTRQAANCPQTAKTSSSPKQQLRAAWIATVANIDWPSRPGLPVASQKQELTRLLDALEQMHMNAAIVQVRPAADSFYPSQYGPWSQYLTGVQGKDPGYNPLAFMVEQSHQRNLEFHAWFNPFRVSLQGDIQKLAANHPARQHPDWVVSYGGKLYYNPGEPAVRAFVIGSILEVVKNYDIDAVHLDDYFYPYPVANQDFPDEATYQKYGAAHFSHKADWRRDNINRFIQDLTQAIKQAKRYVKFGISPFGIWRNKSTDPTGSDTRGQTSYDNLYADTRTWIRRGWLDYIVPQIYWNFGYSAAAYEKLVPWWAQEVRGQRVQLYIGHAAYAIAGWKDVNELPRQLQFNLSVPEVHGSSFFSLKDLLANPHGIRDRLSRDIYRQLALVPTMPWMGGKAPHKVQQVSAQRTDSGIVLRWHDSANNNATSYALYRFDGNTPQQCQSRDAEHLLATMRRVGNNNQQMFTDNTVTPGKSYVYYVTALDRLHNESQASVGVKQ